MITSKDNEKLKLVRKLRERKGRERERAFATEGEDLLRAGLAAGALARFVLFDGGERSVGEPAHEVSTKSIAMPPGGPPVESVEPGLLASVSTLGSGTRTLAVWPLPDPPRAPLAGPVVYLDGVGDPGNVGAIVRTADALLGATVALGPDCADPYGPKALRASMGSIFARPPVRAEVGETPAPRIGLVAHGGGGTEALAGAATLCLGAEREGLPASVLDACAAVATIALRGGAESLNVAAAAAVACHITSLSMPAEDAPDA